MMQRCAIIGVLDNGIDGLTPQALRRVREADVVIGNQRTLALFAPTLQTHCQTFDLTGNLSGVPDWIRQAQQDGLRCAVLATGDPLCHGIAAYLLSRLCIDAFDIIPNVSTIHLACARVCLPWQDIKICSVHSKDAGEWIEGAGPEHGLYALRRAIAQHARLAILTSPDNTPDRLARMLVAANVHEQFQIAVIERLDRADERVVCNVPIAELATQRFADPNVVLLWRVSPASNPVLFGLADHQFQQRFPEKGLITKREARAVSLARMQLRVDSIVWDIGAGSGSVGLEAARLCPHGHVYAIEKNAGDIENVHANRQQLGISNYSSNNDSISNYSIVHGKAPQYLEQWPDPDAVFIGGSGGELAELIHLIFTRLKPDGHLVMNFVTFENLSTAIETLKALDADWDVTQLQASRSKPILDMQRLAAENPVWIVTARKGNADAQGNTDA